MSVFFKTSFATLRLLEVGKGLLGGDGRETELGMNDGK